MSPAVSEPDSLTLVESAPSDADRVHDAIPPLVANPNTAILAVAVGTPEPNLTLLQIAAMVAEGVSVAPPKSTVTASDVSETLPVTVALPFLVAKELPAITAVGVAVAPLVLTLEPFAVDVATVVDAPLIKADPKGTSLASAEMLEATVTVAEASLTLVALQVALDVAVAVAGKTSSP